MQKPGYWMNETTGVLRPAVERYLRREALSDKDISALRAYCRQWIAGNFKGPDIEHLRETVGDITDVEQLDHWIERAVDAGCDPL